MDFSLLFKKRSPCADRGMILPQAGKNSAPYGYNGWPREIFPEESFLRRTIQLIRKWIQEGIEEVRSPVGCAASRRSLCTDGRMRRCRLTTPRAPITGRISSSKVAATAG
jgi:hypothetical protein